MPWGFRLHGAIQRVAEETGSLERDLALLHWAAEHGAVGVAKVLLAHGADPSARDEAETTPARAALESEYLRCNHGMSVELFQLITGYGGDTGARGDSTRGGNWDSTSRYAVIRPNSSVFHSSRGRAYILDQAAIYEYESFTQIYI
ncbi:hypothetical protein DL764_001815 [Monosporascus ibericus]|uniref:Uncharacterized protein n=1 Tax=Monosporascus ibericus TaxID=155417 RepID=A0A4Q4TSK7_9PEZI|nr:hypothetical protein DL764_001815 [Monosporascus ibericus]